MRLNRETRFSHPVLSDTADDYLEGEFFIELFVEESRSTNLLTVFFEVTLTSRSVRELVEKGDAACRLFIICLDTHYNQIHDLGLDKSSIEFAGGELRNRVVFRPVICATRSIDDYYSDSLNPEYAGSAWIFRPNDILAVGPDVAVDVGLDKLVPMESIFTLVSNEEVPDNETRINLHQDKIEIASNKDTRAKIHSMREDHDGRSILLNSVYLPAIMQVLSEASDESYTEYRWHKIFSAKCELLGIDIANSEFLADAQKLLRSPLGRLLDRNTG